MWENHYKLYSNCAKFIGVSWFINSEIIWSRLFSFSFLNEPRQLFVESKYLLFSLIMNFDILPFSLSKKLLISSVYVSSNNEELNTFSWSWNFSLIESSIYFINDNNLSLIEIQTLSNVLSINSLLSKEYDILLALPIIWL